MAPAPRNDRDDAAAPSGPRARAAATTSPELDAATLARCRARDAMAFRAFVARYERVVFALISRLTGHGPHVEDLAQETFLRAFRALPGFDPEGGARLSTWLLTIATRVALDARKRRKLAVVPLEQGLAVPHDDGGTPESHHARSELARTIADAAARLPDDQRAAFVLAEFHELSTAEVAQALGVPENTVKTRVFRARERLRGWLSELRRDRS